jgi:hypothetical protein
MCGRARLSSDVSEIKIAFRIPPERPTPNINAKAEGIENKPAFREAFRQRRCLVPVDNFFEWQTFGVVVMMAKLRMRSPAGECQLSHKPASAISVRSAKAIA